MAKDYLHIQKKKKGRTSFCSAQIKCFQNKLLRIKRKSHNISLGCLNISLSRPFPPFIHSFVRLFVFLEPCPPPDSPSSSRTSRFKCIEFPVEAEAAPSALNHSDRPEFDRLLADAGVVAGVHHICDVFVRVWSLWTRRALRNVEVQKEVRRSISPKAAVYRCSYLLHDELGRRNPDGDALVGQLVQHVLEVKVTTGFRSGKSATL